MSWRRLLLGQSGERAAAAYLKKQGYRILDRNYTCAQGEIDLVCRKDDCIVFVEVKTRSSDQVADPESSITISKQRRIQRAASAWLTAHGYPKCAYRFDAVSVIARPGERPDIRHIIEAFLPPGISSCRP